MDSNRGPSAYQPTALPLGQTGSLPCTVDRDVKIQGPTIVTPVDFCLGTFKCDENIQWNAAMLLEIVQGDRRGGGGGGGK